MDFRRSDARFRENSFKNFLLPFIYFCSSSCSFSLSFSYFLLFPSLLLPFHFFFFLYFCFFFFFCFFLFILLLFFFPVKIISRWVMPWFRRRWVCPIRLRRASWTVFGDVWLPLYQTYRWLGAFRDRCPFLRVFFSRRKNYFGRTTVGNVGKDCRQRIFAQVLIAEKSLLCTVFLSQTCFFG